MKTTLGTLLNFDALSAAENTTGASYKEDEKTMQLGVGMFFLNNQMKAQALRSAGDSSFHTKLCDYQQILDIEGFQLVYKLSIPDTVDHYFIYWHPDGILLSFDSYWGDSVNGGKFYYNWKPTDAKGSWGQNATSGGHFTEGSVWIGDHDCREAIRYKIQQLRDNGGFLPQWSERPFLWLLHYQDTKVDGYDYKAINESRIAALPQRVQRAITPNNAVK